MRIADPTQEELLRIHSGIRELYRTLSGSYPDNDTMASMYREVRDAIVTTFALLATYNKHSTGAEFFGNVCNILPSGKVWTSFTSNQNIADTVMDTVFGDFMREREIHFIVDDGDGCELFILFDEDDDDECTDDIRELARAICEILPETLPDDSIDKIEETIKEWRYRQ